MSTGYKKYLNWNHLAYHRDYRNMMIKSFEFYEMQAMFYVGQRRIVLQRGIWMVSVG
jgi:hypothetical protein